MGSITELATGVRAVLDQILTTRTTVTGVVAILESAGTIYARLGEGSAQPDLTNAAAFLEHAYDECQRIVAMLDRARDHAEAFLAFLTGPWQLTDEQVDDLRRDLPEPIGPAERGTGRKTHGRWIGADGTTREIVSGMDAASKVVDDVLRSLGYARLWIAGHVEMKLAGRLCQQFEATGQQQHATIVQNNVPCPLDFGCASLLPRILPPGCSITVHAPNYRQTFNGGAKP